MEQPHYVHNFVQATFDCLGTKKVKGSCLVVSGDGRFYTNEALQIIVKIASANGIRKVVVGQAGLMSTPAVSHLIRGGREKRMIGGFVLTASPNPGGKDQDFGIKFNLGNGAPCPETFGGAVYRQTRTMTTFKFAGNLPDVDLDRLGRVDFQGPFGIFTVEVIDSTDQYLDLMKTIFDFGSLKKLVSRKDFSMVFDGMHGVAGLYAKRIFVEELGADPSTLIRCEPLPDFGGICPDPNFPHTSMLLKRMGWTSDPGSEPAVQTFPIVGAATGGDGVRNRIVGKRFSVDPSDSLAIISANAEDAIPYFSKGVVGIARSMPTSQAVDRVASTLGVPCYEVPASWKFFANLMDKGKIKICGEESFGTGSDHVREMDGIWEVLAWLSILAHRNRVVPQGMLIGVEDIVKEHWRKHGRHYCKRYDYEEVDLARATGVMDHLRNMLDDLDTLNASHELSSRNISVTSADEYSYMDPIDSSFADHQGIRFVLKGGGRIVFCMSGTGRTDATIRLHVERYERDPKRFHTKPEDFLLPLLDAALDLAQLERRPERDGPTWIT